MTASPAAGDEPAEVVHRNEVLLVGRMSGIADRRELPSGVAVVSMRVVVERDTRALPPRAARVDTIDCVSWTPRCQQAMESWEAGDVVEVSGALRRRFRRGDAGPVSRYEIEVGEARLVATATEVAVGAETVQPDEEEEVTRSRAPA